MGNASCVLQAAKARSDQLQQQLAQRGTDLRAANKQLLKLQKEFADKCDEVTADKREQVALQRAHHAGVKASTHCTQIPLYALPPPPPPPPEAPWLLCFCVSVCSCGSLWHQWQAISSPLQILCHSMTSNSKFALLSMLL